MIHYLIALVVDSLQHESRKQSFSFPQCLEAVSFLKFGLVDFFHHSDAVSNQPLSINPILLVHNDIRINATRAINYDQRLAIAFGDE